MNNIKEIILNSLYKGIDLIEGKNSGPTKDPIIYDCTLREGFQTPGGIGANLEERLFAANNIARFAHWAELGMPINPVDYEYIKAIKESFIENERDVGISVLCRNNKSDIDAGVKVLEGYDKTMAHLFIGTSKEHREARKGVGSNVDDFAKNIYDHVKYASEQNFSSIMFSLEDSFRTFEQSPKDFDKFVDAAIKGYTDGNKKVGRKNKIVMNFPDTVGKSSITEFNDMLKRINRKYKKWIDVSVHGHNDTSSSDQQALITYENGYTSWIQTTFGRLGERNGIASTEVMIPLLSERGYLKGDRVTEPENLKELIPVTKAILGALGQIIPMEQAISGYKTQVSTSGVHTSAAMKNTGTYHINGDKYGSKPILEFGPTSGRNQVTPILDELELMPSEGSALENFVIALKNRCNTEKKVFHKSDIAYEAIKRFSNIEDPLKVEYEIITSNNGPTKINIQGTFYGERFNREIEANGTVEGLIEVLDKEINGSYEKQLELENFFPGYRPKIPKIYLAWEKGKNPSIPKGLNKTSDFVQVLSIKDKTDSDLENGIYWGFASGEDTFRTVANSVVDAFVKMATIKEYKQNHLYRKAI